MSDFLQQMARSSAERAEAVRARYRDDELDLPHVRLKLEAFNVIAEIKEQSPSEGALNTAGRERLTQARYYADGGAAAVSVLTEPTRFGGDIEHLREVAALLAGVGIPAMRKDFLVAPVQLLEARAVGASGALLIAAMLDDATLRTMLDCAIEHSLFVLLEAFDAEDLRRIRKLLEESRYADEAQRGNLLVGVNSRNLRTLAVDAARLERLSSKLPGNTICVAESGVATAEDARRVAGYGYRAALVGSALMRHANPAKLILAMRTAGAAVHAG